MGIIVNSLSVLTGSIVGALFKRKIPNHLKENLPVVFGLCSMVMGISKVITLDNLTVVVLSIIVGYIIGEFLHVGAMIRALCIRIALRFKLNSEVGIELLSVAIVTFCFSGTGLLGAFLEGVSQDPTILFSKSILDFFTALIFASIAGYAIGCVSVFQYVVLTFIKYCALWLVPALQGSVMLNFGAVGGVLTLAIGLKMMKLIDIDLANLLPSIIMVIMISNLIILL